MSGVAIYKTNESRERELESVKHKREIIRSTRDAIEFSTSTSGIRAVVRGSRSSRSEKEGSRNIIEPTGYIGEEVHEDQI